jgi:hypothetical protein
MTVRITGKGRTLRDRSSGTVFAWDGTPLFQIRDGRLDCRARGVGMTVALGLEDGVALASWCAPKSLRERRDPDGASLVVLHDGFENVRKVERVGRTGEKTRWAWHDNGQPRAVMPLVDGREEGVARGWDRSGQRQIELEFHAGRPAGSPVCSDAAGAKVSCDPDLIAVLQ